MGFGIFIHRSDSIYDDLPTERYQFPTPYLRRVQECVGEWIIYYEPRKVVDTRGYFAVAKVQQVIPDPNIGGMHIALIEPGTYLDFARPVPFSTESGVVELGLLNDVGRISGRAQAAVRSLSPQDFHRIVSLGLDEDEPLLPRIGEAEFPQGFAEEQSPFELEPVRDRATYLVSRIVRDRVFRRIVLRAYDERCAISGLKLINGGGRAEVDAAHIRPVDKDGPDLISNGIALSGTAHWMFDRGLICLTDDLQVRVSRHVNDRDAVLAFVNRSGRALAPHRPSDRPHPRFLQWHRENCFKQ